MAQNGSKWHNLAHFEHAESIILSVGESDEISIGNIAKLIEKKFDYINNISFDLSKSDGQYKKTADNFKLINLIGNFEFIKIEEGLDKTIDWFIKNYDICRK